MHAEVVHLALVIASRIRWSLMMAIAAADRKANSAIAQAACFALDPGESVAVVDDQVVAGVLAEWHENPEPNFA
jgi:hypothetical protein